MQNIIRVGIADMNYCEAPDLITTIGLGSCVGVVLYDLSVKKCGMVHVMLPDSTKILNNANIAKFADTGIEALYNANNQKPFQRTAYCCLRSASPCIRTL